jgi:Cd2+/Zn2+-exporting ATPase
VAGRGATAEVEGVGVAVGSRRHLLDLQAGGMEALEEASRALEDEGRTCVWMAMRGPGDPGWSAVALFGLADTVRPEARGMVASLRAHGIRRVVMLTGDHARVAAVVARETGVDEFHADLSPEDKVRIIRQLKQEGTVLMLGDGVNDAPALASAHLGVAMGGAGTHVAMETADVVLMGDRLDGVPVLVAWARRAHRVLLQNLIFAMSVIAILLVGALGFSLPLPVGVIGHEGSTVLVCLNGLRLLVHRQ